MKISITIMAHPKRWQQADNLMLRLVGQDFVQRSITWDQVNDEWETGERALEAGIGTGTDYHVVLQDDVILPPNFYDHLAAALANVPMRSLVSLYTGTVRPLPDRVANAVQRAGNASWLQFNTLLWGVGIAIPTAHIADMLENVADRKEVYDTRIGVAYQSQRLPVYYTNPSLVDHDNSIGSLLKQSENVSKEDYEKLPRVARNFIGNKTVTWNNRVLDI